MELTEVARLTQQITAEYQAGQRALRGLSRGVAQHRFITKCMENIGKIHQQLQTLVGDQAMPLIVQALEQADPAGKGVQACYFSRHRQSVKGVFLSADQGGGDTGCKK
jgi:hypothetical protein